MLRVRTYVERLYLRNGTLIAFPLRARVCGVLSGNCIGSNQLLHSSERGGKGSDV